MHATTQPLRFLQAYLFNQSSHLRLDDVRLAEVSDAEEQVELAVSRADDGALAEHERLRALLGPRQLGKDQTGHESLRDDAETRLEHHQGDGVRAVRVHATVTVADRLLSLDREQQRRRKVVHLQAENDRVLNKDVPMSSYNFLVLKQRSHLRRATLAAVRTLL